MSFFSKVRSSVWKHNGRYFFGVQKGGEGIQVDGPKDSLQWPSDIDSKILVFPMEETYSAVIEVPAELKDELLDSYIAQYFSEWIPMEVEDAVYHVEPLRSEGGDMAKVLLHVVAKKEVAQVDEWISESCALLNGLKTQVDLKGASILAVNFYGSWLVLGTYNGQLVHVERMDTFDGFQGFYDGFVQSLGIFPERLVAVSTEEWPVGFELTSVLFKPDLVQLKLSSEDLVPLLLSGAIDPCSL